jgi:predicted ATPase
MQQALEDHDRILREVIGEHGGVVFSTAGDSFGAVFDSARAAVDAAIAAQRAVEQTGLTVRIGLHAGEALERDGDFFGPTVNRAARVTSMAHGGQVIATSAVADLVDGRFDLLDLGEHRLRGVRSPMRLWQVLADGLPTRFPPVASVQVARTNLVTPLSSLVGRDSQVAALTAALTPPCVVTLTGVGGIGKTRLAMAAATEVLPRFADGVWAVELAAVDDPDLAAEVVLATLGSRRIAGMTSVASLAGFCAARRLLVVLDNCEHILDAASAIAEAIVGARMCAVAATSREPLGVAGEIVWPVPSLAPADAKALFMVRAREAGAVVRADDGTKGVIGEICRRLDGIPLAIELAAGRARSMSPAEILDRLDARFRLLRGGPRHGLDRHRTLLATVQWSYDLLSESEQQVFRRLSVFAGGCTAEQASVVCNSDDSNPADVFEVIDLLDRLVARSMLSADRSGAITRYRLLETLRQFGEDALEAAGDSAAGRARHAAYFLAFAETCRRQQSTANAPSASAALTVEWDNLRAAQEWFLANRNIDGAFRMIIASWWHAFFGLRYELVPWAHSTIDLPGARDDPRWPTVAGATAMFDWGAGELDQAASLASEANTVAREHGWPDSYEAHLALVGVASFTGDFARAEGETEIIEAIADEHADPIEIGSATCWRVMNIMASPPDSGSPEAAYQTAVQLIENAKPRENPYELALLYFALTVTSRATGRADEAHGAYWLVRRYTEQTSNRFTLGMAVYMAAVVASEPNQTLELLHEAISIYRGTDWNQGGTVLRGALSVLARLRCTETVAAAYGAWRKWYPHFAVAGRDEDREDLERTLEDHFGPRLSELYAEGATWTLAELATSVYDEVDQALAIYNH